MHKKHLGAATDDRRWKSSDKQLQTKPWIWLQGGLPTCDEIVRFFFFTLGRCHWPCPGPANQTLPGLVPPLLTLTTRQALSSVGCSCSRRQSLCKKNSECNGFYLFSCKWAFTTCERFVFYYNPNLQRFNKGSWIVYSCIRYFCLV